MNDHVGRFVDHRHLVIFIENIEGNVFWLRAIVLSLVAGALSELGSLDEARAMLRSFVVPSLGLGHGL